MSVVGDIIIIAEKSWKFFKKVRDFFKNRKGCKKELLHSERITLTLPHFVKVNHVIISLKSDFSINSCGMSMDNSKDNGLGHSNKRHGYISNLEGFVYNNREYLKGDVYLINNVFYLYGKKDEIERYVDSIDIEYPETKRRISVVNKKEYVLDDFDKIIYADEEKFKKIIKDEKFNKVRIGNIFRGA